MSGLTAATVKRDVLEPTLDARALNLEQERLIFNPTPEADSLLEYVNALCQDQPELCAAALSLLTRLVTSNQQEGVREQHVARFADQLTTDLRRQELCGQRPAGVPAKEIARTLGSPLDAWREDVATASEVVEAMRLFFSAPSAQLLAPAVRHNLGGRRYRLLEQLVQSFNERGPGVGSSEPAANRGRPGDTQEA